MAILANLPQSQDYIRLAGHNPTSSRYDTCIAGAFRPGSTLEPSPMNTVPTNTVPTHIVEKILKITAKISKCQATIDTIQSATVGHPSSCRDSAAWLAVTIEDHAWFTKQLNLLKRDHGIYPYHDGTVWVQRPAKANLKPAVPASDHCQCGCPDCGGCFG